MFEEVGLLGNIAILLASLLALDKSSDLTITNSVKVADITGLGKTTVGFLLLAFSTSLPELFVSIFAAFDPESISLAIGNVLGSNIVNICLILGVCFLLATWRSPNNVKLPSSMAIDEMRSLNFGLFIASIVPLSLIYIGYASRFVGVILLTIFVFNALQLSRKKTIVEKGSSVGERQKPGRYIVLTFLGAAGVVISSFFIVDSASYIAVSLGVPRVVIGATIVAFGTSVPELVTSVDATRRGHLDLALGNIVGSGFINITCILGIALVSSNLRVNMAAFSNLVMFSLMTTLLLWYFFSSERISWREGVVLLFMYLLFLTVSFGGYKI